MKPQPTFQPQGEPISSTRLLPVQPPGQIIGRNRELATAHSTIKAGGTAFLAGSSGMGKSAVAAVVATAYIARNAGGVLWLHVLEDDITSLIARIGRAYGLNTYNPADWTAYSETVRELLAEHHPLLVLDGTLDLSAAEHFVRTCVPDTPVLIANERSGPGPWTLVELEPLSEADSQALFTYYAGQQDTLHTEDIAGVCRFLGGLPLSIELAARLVAIDKLTPAELLAMLPPPTGQPTQQIMTGLVFKRLQPAVQGLLLVLSAVYTGAASVGLISDLSNVPAAGVLPVMRGLAARGLVEESIQGGESVFTLHESVQSFCRAWLRNYGRLPALEQRAIAGVLSYGERNRQNYDLLALEVGNMVGTAALATERGDGATVQRLLDFLSEPFVAARGFGPEADQMRRLLHYLTATANESATRADETEAAPFDATQIHTTQVADAASLAQTIPIADRQDDSGGTPIVPLGARVAASMPDTMPSESVAAVSVEDTQPSEDTGSLAPVAGDGRAMVDESAALFTELEQYDTDELNALDVEMTQPNAGLTRLGTSAHLEQTVPSAPLISPPTMPDDHDAVGQADYTVPATALPTLPLAGTPAAPPDDVPEESAPEVTVAMPARSLPELEQDLIAAQQADDPARQAIILQTMGSICAEQGDSRAVSYYEQALAIYEARGDRSGSAACLEALAALAAREPDRSLEYARRGAELAAQVGDRVRLGRLHSLQGDAQLAQGSAAAAIDSYSRAVEILRSTENWSLIANTLHKLGSAYLASEKPQEAILIFEQANVIFHRTHQVAEEARGVAQIGSAYVQQRRWSRAQEYFERALYMARERFDVESEGRFLAMLGYLRHLQHDRDGAVRHYRQALHVAYTLNNTAMQTEYALALGVLLMDESYTLSQAAQLLAEAGERAPDDKQVQRLMRRAQRRYNRFSAAGVVLPSAERSNRDYAASGYVL